VRQAAITGVTTLDASTRKTGGEGTIGESDAEIGRDADAVDFHERQAPRYPLRILHRDVVTRGTIEEHGLEAGPCRGTQGSISRAVGRAAGTRHREGRMLSAPPALLAPKTTSMKTRQKPRERSPRDRATPARSFQNLLAIQTGAVHEALRPRSAPAWHSFSCRAFK
jgi:hypothetical protein